MLVYNSLKAGVDMLSQSLQLPDSSDASDKMHTETVLATTLVLAFTEIWWVASSTSPTSQIMSGFDPLQHLRSAEILMRMVVRWSIDGDPRINEANAGLLTFLYNTWYYMDLLIRLVGGYYARKARESIYFPIPIPQKRDSLMGYATTLFPLIGEVADLCSRVQATPANSASTISQAVVLQNKIQNWTPGVGLFSDIQDDPHNIQQTLHILPTAEAHRYATLLYLHQAVPEIYSLSSKQLAKITLNYLAAVSAHSNAVFVHVYPLLVAGCEADEEEDRQWVRERWQLMAAPMWIGNVDSCWEITQVVWSRRDAANVYKNAKPAAHGDQHRLLDTQDTGKSIEEMDPELTVRGRLHWAGVVKDCLNLGREAFH
jgi:hypothetical protein